jgi:BirA family transcriptional regulator, biotin operon repressor / biotin---[acetyl-CoA-carboxylase] ligase
MQLDPIAIEAGVRVTALATIGSTNEEAIRRVRHGERAPFWVTSEAQTAGRGRLGRSWNSPPGNLYATLALRDPAPLERAPELAFVAVLALRDAIAAEAPELRSQLRFKWPNDLLLKDEKCAGILIEGEIEPRKSVIVVIGIGVNCAHHPPMASPAPPNGAVPTTSHHAPFGQPGVLFPATDLHAHGAQVTPRQLFTHLSATMCARIGQWNRGDGFAAVLGDWLSGARGIGQQISVRQEGKERTGRFLGLDRSGRLVLELSNGSLEKIAAGDVFPLALGRRRKISGLQG